ncbi:MAG: hypothetical protein K6E96_08940 [Bacteroidales bacterium]|jgi:hypothetical protein|nr:hypothetical protein [Bacteroidales bacterium]
MNRWFILTLVALLVGCGATKQGGGEAVCDCQRAVKVPDKAFRTFLVDKKEVSLNDLEAITKELEK